MPRRHDFNLAGVSLTLDGKSCYIPLLHEVEKVRDLADKNEEPMKEVDEIDIYFNESLKILENNELLKLLKQNIFEDPSVVKIAYDAKAQARNLLRYGIKCKEANNV